MKLADVPVAILAGGRAMAEDAPVGTVFHDVMTLPVTGTYTVPADADPSTLQVYIGTADMSPAAPYTYLVDDILVTTESDGGGPELPPDFVPGGAVNPMPTPVNSAPAIEWPISTGAFSPSV